MLQLIRPGKHKARLYGSWLALCLGLLLLFVALQSWIDFRVLLSGRGQQDMMAQYLVIGKKISTGQAGSKSLFTQEEIKDITLATGVQQVGNLQANQFPVHASLGGSLGFSTELFLESVDDRFLDQLPPDWHWEPGDPTLPVILSNDFLNLYNYGFALSQGLPQLSQTSIQSIPFQIIVADREAVFRAKIVGFTDRISSVLVPQNFMMAMNQRHGGGASSQPSRLILQVKDPSDRTFIQYLEEKNYTTNADQLRWNRVRTVVQAIVGAVGFLALVVIGMSVLAFILFIEISIQRAANNIRLLLQIGYQPKMLQQVLYRYFIRWILSAILAAGIIALATHLALAFWLQQMGLLLPFAMIWPIGLCVLIMALLLAFLLRRAIKGMLGQID